MKQEKRVTDYHELITLLFFSFGLVVILELIQKGNISSVGTWILTYTSAFFLNSVLIFFFLCIFFLSERRWAWIFLSTSVLVSFSIVNTIKLHFKNDVFAFQDFYLLSKINGIISQYLNGMTIFWIGFAAALLIFLSLILFAKAPTMNRNYYFSLIAFLFLAGFHSISSGFDITPDRSRPVESYDENGFFYSFVESASHIIQEKPSGYSSQKIKDIVNSLHSETEETKPNTNVIFVQLESFFDPLILNNVEISEDPIPNFRKLADQFPSGTVTVPVYGGTTVNTEFEVLTSFDMTFFASNTVPYAQYLDTKQLDALPYYFRNLGYHTTAIHNHTQTFYNRHKVYQNLGFDVFMGKEAFIEKSTNALGWMTDDTMVNMLVETLNRTAETDFIFSVTVQAHGKYPEEYLYGNDTDEEQITVSSDSLSEEEETLTSNYLHELRETDKMIGTLVNQLSNYDEDVIVVFYGDHLPNLGNQGSVYTNLGLSEAEKYETPYVIWSNSDISIKNQELDSTELALPILDELDLVGPLMFQVTEQYEGTPSYFEIKELLQYDLLFGEKYSYKNSEFPYEKKDIAYTLLPTSVSHLEKGVQGYKILGNYFIQGMTVEIEGKEVPYEWINAGELIIIPSKEINIGDEVLLKVQDDQNNDVMTYYYFVTDEDIQ